MQSLNSVQCNTTPKYNLSNKHTTELTPLGELVIINLCVVRLQIAYEVYLIL